jgi:hypothetical protein
MFKSLLLVVCLAAIAECRLMPTVCIQPAADMKVCMKDALRQADVAIDGAAVKECFSSCAIPSQMEKFQEIHDCYNDLMHEEFVECVDGKVDEDLEEVAEAGHKAVLRYRANRHYHETHTESNGHSHDHLRRYRRSVDAHDHGAHSHHYEQHGHHMAFVIRKAGECSDEAKTCVETAFGHWASEEKQAELHDIVKAAKHDCIMAPPTECKDAMFHLTTAENECMKENVEGGKAARAKCHTAEVEELYNDFTSKDGHPRGHTLGLDVEY